MCTNNITNVYKQTISVLLLLLDRNFSGIIEPARGDICLSNNANISFDGNIRTLSRYISETVQDRDMVTVEG